MQQNVAIACYCFNMKSSHPPPPAEKDPVCGMSVDPKTVEGGSLKHEGVRYFFCKSRCRERFRLDPARFLGRTDGPADEALSGASTHAIYICPMDPEVRQDHPGPCPICGMALEPLSSPG